MHELSIAQNIVYSIEQEVKKLKKVKSVIAVEIAIGRYHQVIPENLDFAYEVATKDTVAEGSKLKIDILPIKAKCLNCGWQGELDDIWMICKKCEKTDLEIVSGKEFYVKNIELELK